MDSKKKFRFKKDEPGIAMLLIIIIIGSAALIMSYSASILGLGELEMGYSFNKGGEAFFIADGCMEESMRRLKLDASYSGGVLNLGDGSCTINISSSGADRTITIVGSTSQYTKSIEANITLSGENIAVNSWEEISS